MKNPTLPNANPELNRQAKPKRAKLRAIDQGSVYDVTGKLRGLTRQIERGELGDVRNVIVIVSNKRVGFGKFDDIKLYGFGPADCAEAHFMVSTAKNRLEPA